MVPLSNPFLSFTVEQIKAVRSNLHAPCLHINSAPPRACVCALVSASVLVRWMNFLYVAEASPSSCPSHPTPAWILRNAAPVSPFSLLPCPSFPLYSVSPVEPCCQFPRLSLPSLDPASSPRKMAPELSSLQLDSSNSRAYLSSPSPLLPLSLESTPVRLSLSKLS